MIFNEYANERSGVCCSASDNTLPKLKDGNLFNKYNLQRKCVECAEERACLCIHADLPYRTVLSYSIPSLVFERFVFMRTIIKHFLVGR